MKEYIVIEARFAKNCACSEVESLGAWAETFRTFDDAFHYLRERADGSIYEAFEGLDERDGRTDEAMAELFGDAKPCDITPSEADTGWSWENCDYAYIWRITESEV